MKTWPEMEITRLSEIGGWVQFEAMTKFGGQVYRVRAMLDGNLASDHKKLERYFGKRFQWGFSTNFIKGE